MLGKGYTVEAIAAVIHARLEGNGERDVVITDMLIDSRKLISPQGCLFFALTSKKNDGHKYIQNLYKRGVRHFVVNKVSEEFINLQDSNFLIVSNPLDALQAISAFHRKQFKIPVVGITGSNGKTIVKEWLFQLLSDDLKIIRSPKSYNSQIGVPLSVAHMEEEHELAIFEAGISEQDEMDSLQAIIQPTIGIFTNIGQAHDENFIHSTQKAGEKLKLFTKADTLIYCSDYPEIQEVVIRSGILEKVKPFSWSRKIEADLQIENTTFLQDETVIEAKYKDEKIGLIIPFTDEASVENAIHCWAYMLTAGYDSEEITRRMMRISSIAMRLEMKEGVNNCMIINDSYNSDINSLKIALDFVNQQKQFAKRTLILSDILQSGRNDVDLYTEISEIIASKGITRLIGIGSNISKQADKFKLIQTFYNSTRDFLDHFRPADYMNEIILIKGARVFEFEQISKVLQQKAHETELGINLTALIHNLDYYKSSLKNKSTRIMAMVKAFSYGSGSFEIASVLQYHNVDYLAVAYVDEGVELRNAGIQLPIMVMNPDEQSFDAIIRHSLEPEIYSFRSLSLLEKAIRKNIIPRNKPVKIHIKLDTGMHRLGFLPEEIEKLIKKLKSNPYIYVQSVFSHLAASEDVKEDGFTNKQIKSFEEMSLHFTKAFDHYVLRHILNSAGINRFPDAQFDMVRVGIGLYGIATNTEETDKLHPVSQLRSSVSQVKVVKKGDTIGYGRKGAAKEELKIAIIPIGYADGISRSLGNGKGEFIIKKKLCPTIGNICMDMCMLDVTGLKVKEGDEVIIFGNENPIQKIAEAMGTIPYEVLTSISTRVKRIYYQE